jgi:outer membrane lipoprotein
MKKMVALITIALLFPSCAHVISKPLREKAVTDIPFEEIRRDTDKYIGKTIILGGVIVETRNTVEGTIIEAIQAPIDAYGSITDPDRSEGRFQAIYRGYLDPLIYKKGREVTIAGELVGSREKTLGEIEYRYPFLEIKEMHLWEEKREYYYPPSYPPYWYRPYWYEPWWYGPYYP